MSGGNRGSGLTTPDLIILGFLMERPMHGYQIICELKERQVEDWAGVSKPQVYYSLKKLEASGLIRGETEKDPSTGPERRIYSLMKGARAALATALDSDRWAISRPVPPFNTWVMLSTYAKESSISRIIEQRRCFLSSEIRKEKMTLERMVDEDSGQSHVAKMLIPLVIENFERELSWLDEFLEKRSALSGNA
jgi:DNA-binding PadR family transcriptional regulator